jgi:type I restriction enzyme S subunit
MNKIKLGDYCNPNLGQIKKEPDELIDYIDISSVDNESKRIIGYQTMTFGEAPSRARKAVRTGNILVSTVRPNLNAIAILEEETPNISVASTGFCVLDCKENVDDRFIFNFCKSKTFVESMVSQATGASYPAVSDKIVRSALVPQYSYEEQCRISGILDGVASINDKRKNQLNALDDLIKARFVEMFGDLKSNSKGWQIVGFNDCAVIDTNMIRDFKEYVDYPHIGIDSIEKDTGKLIGYRTIAEDGVISGKYLFSPRHIIYSKIRPNLNKVALPDFDGLCSADAYPILPKEEICNREYLGYTLRSRCFLDYILAFSNRTNLPKVNKNQVEGFVLPLPPIDLQNKFTTFVKQVNKSKVAVQKALDETQLLFDSLMQQYFG